MIKLREIETKFDAKPPKFIIKWNKISYFIARNRRIKFLLRKTAKNLENFGADPGATLNFGATFEKIWNSQKKLKIFLVQK